MFFSFRISSTRFSHSFMGQALFPVLRNRYYIVRRINDIAILVSTRGDRRKRVNYDNDDDNDDDDDDDVDDDDDNNDDDDNDDVDDGDGDGIIMCVNERERWDAT